MTVISGTLQASATPLEKMLGIKFAETDYDKLTITEQIILDLMIEGWSQTDIAEVMDISQPTVSIKCRRIGIKLANSYLKRTLEARISYREIIDYDH